MNPILWGGLSMALDAAAGSWTCGAAARRAELYTLMGDLPARDRKITAQTISVEERPGFILEKLVLDVNGLGACVGLFHQAEDRLGQYPCRAFQPLARRRVLSRKRRKMLRPKQGIVSFAGYLTRGGGSAVCAWICGASEGAPPRTPKAISSKRCFARAACCDL